MGQYGVFTGVYGPFTKEDRECLWEEFGAIRGLWGEPWCVGGDFNVILSQGERSRQGRISPAMRRFAQVMNDLELVDLPLQVELFMWSGGFQNQAWARLDRPIAELVAEGMLVSGRASYRLATKLKVIKQNLKVWNKRCFGNLESNKMAALQQVDYWDQVEEEQDVKNGIVDAFQRLLTEDSEWKADMGEEILEMFKEFHEQKAFLKSLNTTFLVLIPKKGGAEELGDFRPISLVGGLYKLLAKVLANRIKNVVGKVVSSDQNAFVMNRQILDASLIANEVIDSWKKRGEKGLICKLDIEKAYDSVNWKFLMRVMQKMGFGVKWREWIWSCISTAKFSVLINGEPAGFFSSSRGLRQGDPYPHTCSLWGWRIQRGRGQAVNISHLLFADDAIVFCEAKKDDMTFLSWILCWFEAASGLRINLAKSEIIPVGEVEEILEMAVELGCKVGKLPSTYLGLPLGAPNKAGSVWDGVEERMRWKLALWKRQYISKGGRIALIKSTLASMPLIRCPCSVCLG
ncbi:LINE-1 reverse transcriptase-like [Vitis vinifera]|uniref:LINE-1 reverse transcriptase-like n=1 Tax=Vitis vinifera TaxID=29760 RepID=A0A438H3W3_VITVI|nr:LINE-1 reverse transcriptase-like [Vitis vinifera]